MIGLISSGYSDSLIEELYSLVRDKYPKNQLDVDDSAYTSNSDYAAIFFNGRTPKMGKFLTLVAISYDTALNPIEIWEDNLNEKIFLTDL